jgi:hypothetical protein
MRIKYSQFCGWFRQAACCNGVEPTAFFALNDLPTKKTVSSKASLRSDMYRSITVDVAGVQVPL